MGTKKYTTKLRMIWLTLWCRQATLVFQRRSGEAANSLAYGSGDLKDMVLKAAEMKRVYNDHIEIINEMATHGGELHELLAFREAIDTLEQT